MAIDTITKRKSVINAGMPSMALLPPPDGGIAAVDRRHLADLYAFIPQTIVRGFWVPDRREGSIVWSADQKPSTDWVQDQDGADAAFQEDGRVPAE